MDKVYIVGSDLGVFASEEALLSYFNEYEAVWPDSYFIKKERLQDSNGEWTIVMGLYKEEPHQTKYIDYIGIWEIKK